MKEILQLLPVDFYNNQVGSRTVKEQDDEDEKTIDQATSEIIKLVVGRIKNKEQKFVADNLTYGDTQYQSNAVRYGYNQAIADIIREVQK